MVKKPSYISEERMYHLIRGRSLKSLGIKFFFCSSGIRSASNFLNVGDEQHAFVIRKFSSIKKKEAVFVELTNFLSPYICLFWRNFHELIVPQVP